MASVRLLKKEINSITEELLSECIFRLELPKNGNSQEIVSIIDEVIVLRDETIQKLQAPKKVRDPKNVKQAFGEIKKSYIDSLNSIIEQLNKIK